MTEHLSECNRTEQWSARTWTTFVAQRISVALHRAAALEILQSLRMGPVEGRDLY